MSTSWRLARVAAALASKPARSSSSALQRSTRSSSLSLTRSAAATFVAYSSRRFYIPFADADVPVSRVWRELTELLQQRNSLFARFCRTREGAPHAPSLLYSSELENRFGRDAERAAPPGRVVIRVVMPAEVDLDRDGGQDPGAERPLAEPDQAAGAQIRDPHRALEGRVVLLVVARDPAAGVRGHRIRSVGQRHGDRPAAGGARTRRLERQRGVDEEHVGRRMLVGDRERVAGAERRARSD